MNDQMKSLAHVINLTRKTLDEGLNQIPYEVTERLRATRAQALSAIPAKQIKRNPIMTWLRSLPQLTRALIATPIAVLALMFGLKIHEVPQTPQAPMSAATTEVKKINIDAVLNEKVPLQAYLNEDFNQYIEQDVHQNAAQAQSASFSPNEPQP